MISCLTVTRDGKQAELRRAMACFAAQTFRPRQLVIVHDGDTRLDRDIRVMAQSFPGEDIVVQWQPADSPLGALRNASVDLARHPVVCQWDDDDLYHPCRLETQYGQLRDDGSDFCFLTDQLHLFETDDLLFWDDWSIEPYPMNLIAGTLMGYKDKLARYPELGRGEDTPVVLAIHRDRHRISQISQQGYLYIYVYNGRNAWSAGHHAAISALKRIRGEALVNCRELLLQRLREYPALAGRVLHLPDDGTAYELQL